MKSVQVLLLTLLSVMAASAQVLRLGPCPQPPVQADFDASRYLGQWYEIKKLPTIFQKGECAVATYSLKAPGVIGVLNRELLEDGSINAIVGSAKVKDPSEPAKLQVSFNNSPPGPYWVLSTDYESHSLVYGCTNFGLFHMELSWVLSRKPTLLKETMAELDDILTTTGVDVSKMVMANQDDDFCWALRQ
ncbi:apolipoprotein Da, duplicate 2 [Synchiropus splendidus]|uniref:apolipoprotein Da, duplicate 2 n=1 Tax=Synchiropus splendidus TaxID=270530 RepID=UPI00237DC2A4|nr:apolipoprotein Da, duplicate 2 [Synchiropus splendidus]